MKLEVSKQRLQELAAIGNKPAAIRENAQFSFTFDYNTDDDDIEYIQNMLNKAGADAYAKADDAPEQILVRAFDAQGLAKAKAAIQRGGFQIQENKRLQEGVDPNFPVKLTINIKASELIALFGSSSSKFGMGTIASDAQEFNRFVATCQEDLNNWFKDDGGAEWAAEGINQGVYDDFL